MNTILKIPLCLVGKQKPDVLVLYAYLCQRYDAAASDPAFKCTDNLHITCTMTEIATMLQSGRAHSNNIFNRLQQTGWISCNHVSGLPIKIYIKKHIHEFFDNDSNKFLP